MQATVGVYPCNFNTMKDKIKELHGETNRLGSRYLVNVGKEQELLG